MNTSDKDFEHAVPTDPESICRYFVRVSTSLIEEPEVCEWCEYFERGMCLHKA